VAGCGTAIAIGGTPPLGAAAWVAAGVALTLSLRSAPRAASASMDELERHVMRCRRRGESAWTLVAHVPAGGRAEPEEIASSFRLTDSVLVQPIPHGYELAGVFDEPGLDREALERRLRAKASAMGTTIAWKRFPHDGVTLAVLLDEARAALSEHAPVESAAIVPPVLEHAHAPATEGK
jgi:hypothetical protein